MSDLEVGNEATMPIDNANSDQTEVTVNGMVDRYIEKRQEESSSLRHRSSSAQKVHSGSESDGDVGLDATIGLRDQLKRSHSILSTEERLMANDTYTMMIMAESMNTEEWFLGCVVWIVQVMLMSFILHEWWHVEDGPPLRVPWYVTFTQFTTCVLVVMMQTDVSRAIQNILIMMHAPEQKCMKTLPSCMKLVQGLLTIVVSFLTIVRSESVRGLIEGFVAIIIVSEFDDAFYNVAKNGFFNMNLALRAKDATDVPLRDLVGDALDKRLKARVRNLSKCSILIITFVILFFWTYIINRQYTGYYAKQNLPKCFEVQRDRDPTRLSNRLCEQDYNTAFCNFDGGDCTEINKRYPNCRADFPYKIGDGHCDFELNDKRCGFDGGDCITIDKQRNDWVVDGRCKLLEHHMCENLSTSQNDTVADVLWCDCSKYIPTKFMSRYNPAEEVKGFGLTPYPYRNIDGDDDAKAFFNDESGYGSITDIWIENKKLSIIPIAADFFSNETSYFRIVGNPNHNNNTGMVTISRNKTGPPIELYGNYNGSQFGRSVAITNDGGTIFVGAPGNLDPKSNEIYRDGRVFKYEFSDSSQRYEQTWQDVKDFGYGHSISVSGDGSSLAVGAPFEGNGRLFIYNNITENESTYDRFDGDHKEDLFGGSVSMSNDGSLCAVGASAVGIDGAYSDKGGEYVKLYKSAYDENKIKYVQFSDTITTDVASAFGFSVFVSEDGRWLSVGAPRDDAGGSKSDVGKAYLYEIGKYRVSLVRVLEGDVKKDWFGFWVRVYENGSHLAVGAPALKDNNEYVRIFSVPSSSGGHDGF